MNLPRLDIGALLLRLAFGGTMLVQHGLPKLLSFSSKMDRFPDPIGLGSTVSLSLAVSAEVFCAAAVVVGLFTRLAAIPLMITMLVAFFVVHGGDPFQKRELAFVYLVAYAAIALIGPGRFSLDRKLRKKT